MKKKKRVLERRVYPYSRVSLINYLRNTQNMKDITKTSSMNRDDIEILCAR